MRVVVAAFVLLAASCSNERSFCFQQQKCDPKDNPDQDFVDVCSAQSEGLLAGLRANKEKQCKDLADALDSRDGCEAQLSCDDFRAEGDAGKCNQQRVATCNACKAIENARVDCESILTLLCATACGA